MEIAPISTQALPAGTRVEEFVIEKVLGSGGFGITYLARDTSLGRQVVIKENLPVQFCFRDTHSLTVAPRHSHGEDAENFRWSLENFSKEAAMLASLDHPGIVKVLRSFQAFGTAYFVMPFVEGVTLDELITERRQASQAFTEVELKGLLERVLDALSYLHDRGIYHRDIKPGNLLITSEGLPVLIDFGSARQRLSERSMTVIESPGYTPFEQLQSRGNVGPWSDLYALGGTLVKAITGEAPPKAMDRMRNDPFLPLVERVELVSRFSKDFLQSLDQALAVDEAGRWQNAGDWQADLKEKVPVEQAPVMPETDNWPAISPGKPSKKAQARSWVLIACVVFTLGAWAMISSNRREDAIKQTATDGATIQSERENAQAAEEREDLQRAAEEKAQAEAAKLVEEQDFEIAPGVKIPMCWIPPGGFLMGSPANKSEQQVDTQHRVTLTQGFWLAKTETTQAQWQAVMGNNPSHFKGENLPVETVSWNAIAGSGGFIEKVNQSAAAGGRFSLPTEAQWEYACRAGTTGAYAGELAVMAEMAWFGGNSGDRTHPVAGKKANGWGLHDMHGNVWEWCADVYCEYSSGAVTDPRGASSGSYPVFRGGSRHSDAIYCRVAFRNFGYNTGDLSNDVGFRLAHSSVQQVAE